MAGKLLGVGVLAAALGLRMILFAMPSISAALQLRMEFSTPVTGSLGVKECLFLLKRNFPMYSGGICHHQPLLIHLFAWLQRVSSPQWTLPLLFSVCDVMIGFCLFQVVSSRSRFPTLFSPVWDLPHPSAGKSSGGDEDKAIIGSVIVAYRDQVIGTEDMDPMLLSCLYLFNPLTVLSCLSLSTALISNACIAFTLLSVLNGRTVIPAFLLAVSSYLSVYPVMIVPPVVLLVIAVCQLEKRSFDTSSSRVAKFLASFVFACFLLLACSCIVVSPNRSSLAGLFSSNVSFSRVLHASRQFVQDNSKFIMQYLSSTYGFIFAISDHSVNIGPYWYFFVEIFDQFRSFFVAVVQLHLLSFSIPLTIKFRDDPLFATFLILGSSYLLKSYASLPDIAFWLSFCLLTQAKLFKYFRNPLVSFSLVFASLLLLPSFHFTWIYLGSGNSNFCYAITLVFAVGITTILSDCIRAWLKRTYEITLLTESYAGRKDLSKWIGIDVSMK